MLIILWSAILLGCGGGASQNLAGHDISGLARSSSTDMEMVPDGENSGLINIAIIKKRYAISYNNIGLDYLDKGDYGYAIAYLDKAIELNHNEPIIYENRGLAYEKLGHYEQAQLDYDEAYALRKYSPVVYTQLGSKYCKLGHYELAIKAFNTAIELDSKYFMAFN